MAQETSQNFVTINVDGADYQVPAGMNLVDAAHYIGREIPHYCYHPKLSVSGNCRMCLVEMGTPVRDRATGEIVLENGTAKIGWQPKAGIACATKVSPGLHVRLNSPVVKNCREGVTEFLLANHPLDCPICDQAGECKLQEYSAEYGRCHSRYVEEKNRKPKKTPLGPRVMLDNERCILCSRCVRFCKEILKDPVLGFTQRGSKNTLACFPGRQFDSNYSVNTVDICPVGALTSVDFRFKMRVWFLKKTHSISTESSVGVNITIWSREGVIYRITPRKNDAVNGDWMPDSGRELYKTVTAKNRLENFLRQNTKVSDTDAFDAAVSLLRAGGVGIVASGFLSVEEQFRLRRLNDTVRAKVFLPNHPGEDDGFLISNERVPNLRGAKIAGLTANAPDENLENLAKEIENGTVKTLLVFHENLVDLGVPASLLKKSRVNIIYIGTHENDTAALATVVIPAPTVFEKSGTFVNRRFRLQKFQKAVDAPVGIPSEIETLANLQNALNNGTAAETDLEKIWEKLANDTAVLAGISFAKIPAQGVELNIETESRDISQ